MAIPPTSPDAARRRRARNNRQAAGVARSFEQHMNARYAANGMPQMASKARRGRVDRPPGAPASVQAVAMGEQGAAIMWKHARDDHAVKGYRVYRDGQLVATVRGSNWFVDPQGGQPGSHYEVRAIDNAGMEGRAAAAPVRATAGMQAQAPAGAAPGTEATTPSQQAALPAGSAPQLRDMRKVDQQTVAITWTPVQGATAYGIYQDGKLIGHTRSPQFAGQVRSREGVMLTVDAVMPDGTRTPQTGPVGVRIGQQGVEMGQPEQAAAPATGQAPPAQPQPQAQAQAPQAPAAEPQPQAAPAAPAATPAGTPAAAAQGTPAT